MPSCTVYTAALRFISVGVGSTSIIVPASTIISISIDAAALTAAAVD